jgi:hypothetical protein
MVFLTRLRRGARVLLFFFLNVVNCFEQLGMLIYQFAAALTHYEVQSVNPPASAIIAAVVYWHFRILNSGATQFAYSCSRKEYF